MRGEDDHKQAHHLPSPDDSSAVVLGFEVRIREAEEHLLQLVPLQEVRQQLISRRKLKNTRRLCSFVGWKVGLEKSFPFKYRFWVLRPQGFEAVSVQVRYESTCGTRLPCRVHKALVLVLGQRAVDRG